MIEEVVPEKQWINLPWPYTHFTNKNRMKGCEKQGFSLSVQIIELNHTLISIFRTCYMHDIVLLVRKIAWVNLLLRANRKRSLKARERVQNHRKKRKKQNLTKEGRVSINMKIVSGSWSLHSKGRGDCRLMQLYWWCISSTLACIKCKTWLIIMY